MRKSIYIFLAILVGLHVFLSEIDRKGFYAAEQIMWRANQQFAKIKKNPNFAPDNAYRDIIKNYNIIIQDFPDSPLVPRAYILIAEVFSTQGEFEKAREILNEFYSKYPEQESIQAQATAAIAKSYEMQGEIQEAIVLYYQIIRDFPLTDIGLSAPLYIVNLELLNNVLGDPDDYYDEAIAYYITLARKHPNTIIEFKAMTQLSNCYLGQENWNEAILTLGEILARFRDVDKASTTVKAINTIVSTQPDYLNTAISIYRKFISENPQHPINKSLDGMIHEMLTFKERGKSKKSRS